MSDIYEYLAMVVTTIRSDPQLRECFIRILSPGASLQQVRSSALLSELEKVNAPDEVKKFVRLLGNEKLAHQVLNQIMAA